VSNDNFDPADVEPTQALADDHSNDETAAIAANGSVFARPSAAASEPTIALDNTAEEEARKRESEAAARREAEARARDEARLRAEERAERERSLGTVTPSNEADVVPVKPAKGTNDRFLGALGLFILRLVTALVIGIRGVQIVTDIPGYTADLTSINVPSAGPIAWVVGIALLVSAVMLVFGFGTRLAGLIVLAFAVATIVFFRWTDFSIFREGQEGFSGDLELLLAGVGFLFLCVGGGGWSIDGGMRRARQKRKYYA